jgi:hypothetical protein
MTIQLNPEQQQVVGQAIQAGLIRDLDEVAEMGLATIRQKLTAQRPASETLDAEQWSRQLTAWSEGHSLTTPLLPDEAIERDSIYGSRGQ